jgi:hypothetical protein
MGSQTLLDLVGSIVIGGFLLMILSRMNYSNVQNNYKYSGERIIQQNLVEVVKLLEHDFRKIGYCSDYTKIPDRTKAIVLADSNRIWFLTDAAVSQSNQYGNGLVDTLKYTLGPASELTSTPNPNDRYLYRSVNNATKVSSNLGITQFKLTYYNSDGAKITNMPSAPPLGIWTIQIDIAVENTAAFDNDYSYQNRAIWRQIRLSLRNYKTR